MSVTKLMADRRQRLQQQLTQRQTVLQTQQQPIIEQTAQLSQRLVKLFFWSLFGGFVAQFCILFQWVFVTFDWNLVEPVTYFLGYTWVWLGLVFFKLTGRDFCYESIRAELEGRLYRRLAMHNNLDVAKCEALQAEIARLKRDIS